MTVNLLIFVIIYASWQGNILQDAYSMLDKLFFK